MYRRIDNYETILALLLLHLKLIPVTEKEYFQDFMPGNVCFGCGKDNHQGLQIKSYWEGDIAICEWNSEQKYQGWQDLTNGGVLASLIDCHSMCTAMAYATRLENRSLGSEPFYKYATGTLTVKYLKPTFNNELILLKAQVVEQKGRKTTIKCDIYSKGEKSVEAEVIAIRVVDSSSDQVNTVFK